MAQDFAKQRSANNGSKRTSNKKAVSKNTGGSSHWSWFLSGLFAGLLCASIAYLAIIKPPAFQPQIADTELEPAPALEEEDAETELEFYNLLVESEVRVDVVPVAIITEVGEVEEDPINYLLQAGSFQTRLGADERLAKVILLNLDARIVPGVVSGKTLYRVHAGPFTGRSSTEDARDVLATNNIDTIVLQQR